MKVYINTGDRPGRLPRRRLVNAELVKSNERTVLVRLPGGRVVKRKRRRDVR